jgi:hypothetical protein
MTSSALSWPVLHKTLTNYQGENIPQTLIDHLANVASRRVQSWKLALLTYARHL